MFIRTFLGFLCRCEFTPCSQLDPWAPSFSAGALIKSHVGRWMWVMTLLSQAWLKLNCSSWHTGAPTGLNLGQIPEYSSAAEGLVQTSYWGMSTRLLLSVRAALLLRVQSSSECLRIMNQPTFALFTLMKEPLSMDLQFGVSWFRGPWPFCECVCVSYPICWQGIK